MTVKKIKSINIIYPDTKEMLEKLYISYNKNLAKVLVDTLPPEVINVITLELECKEAAKNR